MISNAIRNTKEARDARRIKRILYRITIATFLFATVPATMAWALSTIGLQPMYVVSNSMSPEFNKGDLIIGSSNYQSLESGDIIVFKATWFDNELVTHRIHEIGTTFDLTQKDKYTMPLKDAVIYTKGDNNSIVDPEPTDLNSVVAEVVASVPKLGYYMNPKVIGVLLGVFLASGLAININWEKHLYKGNRRG